MSCVAASTEASATICSLVSLYIHEIEKIFTVLHNENDRMLQLTPEQNNTNLKELEREYQLNHILYHTITAL